MNFLNVFTYLVKFLLPQHVKLPENTTRILDLAKIVKFDMDQQQLQDEILVLSLDGSMISNEDVEVFSFYKKLALCKYAGDGAAKYRTLTKLFNICAVVSPSNAEVERGFSESAHILTKSRNRMSEETFNSKKNIKAHLKIIGGITNFDFSTSLLEKAASSNRAYMQELEEKKNQREVVAQERTVKLVAEKARKTVDSLRAKVLDIECEILIKQKSKAEFNKSLIKKFDNSNSATATQMEHMKNMFEVAQKLEKEINLLELEKKHKQKEIYDKQAKVIKNVINK